MNEHEATSLGSSSRAIADLDKAVAAANALFDDPRATLEYEPSGREEAAAAAQALGRRFDQGGGTLAAIIENARAGAEVLSVDRLQGLSEIIQNADDAGASSITFCLDRGDLLVVHDGRPVGLKDIHALAAPWLTTKQDDAAATGRFGIGLMTLHALSGTLEVHSGDYHVRFGEPTIETIGAPADLPGGFGSPGATVLRIPLNAGVLESSDLMSWAAKWDASGLLFLAHVATLNFVAGDRELSLQLDWQDRPGSTIKTDTVELPVVRRMARCDDGRTWLVHSAELPSPSNVRRAHKATEDTTQIAVALSLFSEAAGELYASLPVANIDRPLRASAQFDPTTGRQGFAPTEWNRALVALVTRLWANAVLDLFTDDVQRAWAMIPVLPQSQASGILGDLELGLLKEARNTVAENLRFTVEGDSVWVGDLAIEVPALTNLLTPSEIAGLAGLAAALPTASRDETGTWRRVLDDWRANGVRIAPPVTVLNALDLIEEPSRSPGSSIALAAAAIEAGLDTQLAGKAFVVARDGSRVRAPKGTDMTALVEHQEGFAVQLGLGTVMHGAHFDDAVSASKVRAWLRERGALIDSSDDGALLRRIADSASRGWKWNNPFTDDQLIAVRDALERLDEKEWVRLGPGIGRAMKLDGFHYRRGHRVQVAVSPTSAYLPKSIDRDQESFALAAGTTPGITWLAGRYATVLKSSLGRTGLGAQRFLRLLGAETAPRLIPHPEPSYRYSGQRPGVPARAAGGPAERVEALQSLGATYTIDDFSSPDLDKVLRNIATDRRATRRRSRASAIIAIFAKSSQVLGAQASVLAADDYRGWQYKEKTKSWWLWQAATIPWLDDASAKPTSPLRLRIKTAATVSVYGAHAEGYLHPFFKACRADVLLPLGVSGEPSMGDLCERLRLLRDGEDGTTNISTECAVIYRALGARLAASVSLPGDLNREQLQAEFNSGCGLIFTNDRWLPPPSVFNGPPVFGRFRSFVPAISGAERLWAALQIRSPSVGDCISVLVELGKTRRAPDTSTTAVMLDTLRVMLRLLAKAPTTEQLLQRLSRAPLWTSLGWRSARPVYAVDDPPLAAGLETLVAVWQPGGEVAQFEPLFDLLKVRSMPADAGTIVVADDSPADEASTYLFRSAIDFLAEDLAKNDQKTYEALRISWSALRAFQVHLTKSVGVRVDSIPGIGIVTVTAKVDSITRRLFLTDGAHLDRVDIGGRTVAGLFNADHRRVSHAWLAAVERARSNLDAASLLELASERERDLRNASQTVIENRLAGLQAQVAARRKVHDVTAAAGESELAGVRSSNPPGTRTADTQPCRVLVDPARLRVVDPDGTIVEGGTSASTTELSAGPAQPGLRDPRPSGLLPRTLTPPRTFTELEKETVGLEVARKVLCSDDARMVDIRDQRGVGADAFDEFRQFFELKVSAGREPDEIRLDRSQIQRALATPHFFLVVVSNLEGKAARPRVRIIADPLNQLRMVESSQIHFDGVTSALSLVFELTP